jgi:hypothetical protein
VTTVCDIHAIPLCAYCRKPINDTCITFKDVSFHVLRDENGNHTARPATCWDKSDQGTKSLP